MSSLKKSCAGCYFFENKTKGEGTLWGFCRVKPPTVHLDSDGVDNTFWPVVSMTDWCKEHIDTETGKKLYEE